MINLKKLFRKKPACWDTVSCNSSRRNKCPYYLNRNYYHCWEVEGTFCKSDQPESSSQKLIICSQCDYYITNLWGLQPTAEQKLNIRKVLQKEIIQMAKISVNDTVTEAVQELKMLYSESSRRITFHPNKNVPKIFSSGVHLKDMVRKLVSQALECLPPETEITITAKDHSGNEVKVVLTSPYPELLEVRPKDLESEMKNLGRRATESDGNPWAIFLGKDRRQDDRRQIQRRTVAADDSAAPCTPKTCRRKSSSRRQTDRRFALVD